MKYPVVLVHGLGAVDRRTIFDFWGRIPEFLKSEGFRVFMGNTDSWGDYESNAELLRKSVDRILEETGSGRVNILAHSKGGIDSRYMIWKHGYGGKVASLTTISTPHHGAELADLVLSGKPIHSLIARRALKLFGKMFGDENPDPYASARQLSTAHMKEFNERVREDPRVHYQAFYTTLDGALDDPAFFFTHWYLKRTSGESDGIVSEKSAKWGTNCRKIEGRDGGISHSEIVDIKKREISGIDIPGVYRNILRELEDKGY